MSHYQYTTIDLSIFLLFPPPFWTSLLLAPHLTPLGCRAPIEFRESYRKFPLAIYFPYTRVYASMLLSPFAPSSPSSPAHRVRKSVLCVSTAALQIGSSVPSFQIPYIYMCVCVCVCVCVYVCVCINILYLFFSFWLTSFCIIDSRFIHLIKTDSNAFLIMAT